MSLCNERILCYANFHFHGEEKLCISNPPMLVHIAVRRYVNPALPRFLNSYMKGFDPKIFEIIKILKNFNK